MTVLGRVPTPPRTLALVINPARNNAAIENMQEISRNTSGTYPLFKIVALNLVHLVLRLCMQCRVPFTSGPPLMRLKSGDLIPFSRPGSSKGLGSYGLSRSSCLFNISGDMITWRVVEGIQCRVSLFGDLTWFGDFGRNESFSVSLPISLFRNHSWNYIHVLYLHPFLFYSLVVVLHHRLLPELPSLHCQYP